MIRRLAILWLAAVASPGWAQQKFPTVTRDDRILIVAPHPDDAEIGVGGTILACRQQGMRVGVIDLTNGEPTPHGSPERRAAETEAATKILGLDWRGNLGLPNRSLQADLESRRALASVFRLTRPKIIVAPYWEDAHPDHVVASRLADDARFWSKLSKSDMPGEPYWPPKMLYFFSIHLRIHPKPAFVFDITPHIDAKMSAIRCYESQFPVAQSLRDWDFEVQSSSGDFQVLEESQPLGISVAERLSYKNSPTSG